MKALTAANIGLVSAEIMAAAWLEEACGLVVAVAQCSSEHTSRGGLETVCVAW